MGSEGAEGHMLKVLREAQRAQEQRDGSRGTNVCCERESAYEDIDLASVGALVKFWETAVVDVGVGIGVGVDVSGHIGGVAKDVCHEKCNVDIECACHPDTSATTTTTTTMNDNKR